MPIVVNEHVTAVSCCFLTRCKDAVAQLQTDVMPLLENFKTETGLYCCGKSYLAQKRENYLAIDLINH